MTLRWRLTVLGRLTAHEVKHLRKDGCWPHGPSNRINFM